MVEWLVAGAWIVAGLVVLVAGGELLVRGASKLASAAGVSPLVIGLTVVAFGTSAPELAVSLDASWAGKADIAVGNVVGSNIFNVLLILGVSALITPLVVSSKLILLDVPLMVAASLLMMLLSWDGNIGRWDGLFLFGCLLAYTIWTVVQSRKETAAVKAEYEKEFGAQEQEPSKNLVLEMVLLVVGLVLLGFGAQWLVDGSVRIAKLLGMSELMIGLTIVAAGTSLPEVAASVVASLRGERDIAVGNVVGSNLFNILCVMGLSGFISPLGVPVSASALGFDLPIMTAVAVACLPVFFTGRCIARWEGGLFLTYYVTYMAYIISKASGASFTTMFGHVMIWFVLPLTFIALLVSVIHSCRANPPETAGSV